VKDTEMNAFGILPFFCYPTRKFVFFPSGVLLEYSPTLFLAAEMREALR